VGPRRGVLTTGGSPIDADEAHGRGIAAVVMKPYRLTALQDLLTSLAAPAALAV
jgi:hypothetical protein